MRAMQRCRSYHSRGAVMIDEKTLRSLIRETIRAELERLGYDRSGAAALTTPKPQPRVELVRIADDRDLMSFANRLLTIAEDSSARAEIRSGRWQFRLAESTEAATPVSRRPPVADSSTQTAGCHRIERGVVGERLVVTIAPGSRIQVNSRVRFTPLALDEIRRRGIQIERGET